MHNIKCSNKIKLYNFKDKSTMFVKCKIAMYFSAFSTRLGYEEHIPGQTRDWNEEIQTTRELPKTNLPERLIRERAIFKVSIIYVRCFIMVWYGTKSLIW